MREGVGANNVKSFELSSLRRFHHLRCGESRLCWRLGAPNGFEGIRGSFVIKVRVTRQTIWKQAHIGGAARVGVIAKRHVAA